MKPEQNRNPHADRRYCQVSEVPGHQSRSGRLGAGAARLGGLVQPGVPATHVGQRPGRVQQGHVGPDTRGRAPERAEICVSFDEIEGIEVGKRRVEKLLRSSQVLVVERILQDPDGRVGETVQVSFARGAE